MDCRREKEGGGPAGAGRVKMSVMMMKIELTCSLIEIGSGLTINKYFLRIDEGNRMKRRKFLKVLTAALGATGLASFFYPLLRYLTPIAPEEGVGTLKINKNEIPAGAAKELHFNNIPIVVINRRGKGYIALSRVCTHLGCLVNYDRDEEIFVCPCHAAEFTREGLRIRGPAPRPLDRIAMRVEGDEIIIG
jgi:cytochrome b6-f complex iron-sulfur subunit